jgi:hypothetical protein
VALAAIGKIGTTKEEVVKKLDDHIDPVQTKLQITDRNRVGVNGDSWHSKVLIAAFEAEGEPWTFRQVKGGALPTSGKVLVDGYLNRSYVEKDRNGRARKGRVYQAGHDDPGYRQPDWRHMIVIDLDRHEFHCIGAGGWAPMSWLWLDKRGQPVKTTNGYMSHFLRVFVIA